jgi:hypothetical protein
MNEYKNILCSKTIWGIGLTFIGLLGSKLGMPITEGETESILTSLLQIIGMLFAIYGRVTASKKLIGSKSIPVIAFMSICMIVLIQVPSGCVKGPDGKTKLNPDASLFLNRAAQTATLIGVSYAISGNAILAPFSSQIIEGVNSIFKANETPEDIGKGLKGLFQEVAISIGDQELNKILMDYVSKELVPEAPGAFVGGVGQFQFNSGILVGLDS